MSNARNLADLLDSNGDVVSGALDNVPASNDASALTTGTLPVDRVPYVGRRNLIINGAMQVWQRGTSGFAIDNYASADRWKIARGTLSQQTFTAGSELGQNRNYANFDFSSATFAYILQPIEDVSTVAGKTITVSFYIKSDTLTNVYFYATNSYGSGGSSATIDKNFESTSITSSWQRITKTFNVTSLSGKTVGSGSYYAVGIYGSLGTALTGDFDIWGFQVEVGSVATPFEHRSYGEELALCQRYYQKTTASDEADVLNRSWDANNGLMTHSKHNTYYDFVHLFPVEMRSSPTCTFFAQSGTGYLRIEIPGVTNKEISATPQSSSSSKVGVQVRFNISGQTDLTEWQSGSGNAFGRIGYTADAEL